MVKFGTSHSQNFVFSIPNFWKLFKKKYSEKYLKKMQNKILELKTSKERTVALLELYRGAPDIWKRSVKAMMQNMINRGKIDPVDYPALQKCGGFGPYSGKGGQCSLKL